MSALDRIRQRYSDLSTKQRVLEVPIPGYDGALVAILRPIAFQTAKKNGMRLDRSNDPAKELHGAADTLIDACVDIRARDPETGQLVALDPGNKTDEPLVFDGDLADLIGIGDVESARQVLLHVFHADGTVNDAGGMAVIACARRLMEWTQGELEEATERVVGESEATPTS